VALDSVKFADVLMTAALKVSFCCHEIELCLTAALSCERPAVNQYLQAKFKKIETSFRIFVIYDLKKSFTP
jgi:hypothetical protein